MICSIIILPASWTNNWHSNVTTSIVHFSGWWLARWEGSQQDCQNPERNCAEQSMLCSCHLSFTMCCSWQTGTGGCANDAIFGPWTAEALRPQPDPHQWGVQLADDHHELGDQPTLVPGDQPAVQQPDPHQPAPATEFCPGWGRRMIPKHEAFLPWSWMQMKPVKISFSSYTTWLKPGSADICVWADKSRLPKEQIAKTVRPPILAPTHGTAFMFQWFSPVLLIWLRSWGWVG